MLCTNGFNSIVVRLRPGLGWRLRLRPARFQFYSSAIKTKHFQTLIILIKKFQFYSSAIKTGITRIFDEYYAPFQFYSSAIKTRQPSTNTLKKRVSIL